MPDRSVPLVAFAVHLSATGSCPPNKRSPRVKWRPCKPKTQTARHLVKHCALLWKAAGNLIASTAPHGCQRPLLTLNILSWEITPHLLAGLDNIRLGEVYL